MIARAPGARVYLACGITDMRKGMVGLAMLVQKGLSDNPFNGAIYAFRGRRAGLSKLLWHDGIGLCMLTKKLEHGQFVWPSTTTTGQIALTTASPPNTDDWFAGSEVAPLSRLCTPGCRITLAASRPSRIWPRPSAMRSDIGPALPVP